THTTLCKPLCQISQNCARSRLSAPPISCASLSTLYSARWYSSPEYLLNRDLACARVMYEAAATHVTSRQLRDRLCKKSLRPLKSTQTYSDCSRSSSAGSYRHHATPR